MYGRIKTEVICQHKLFVQVMDLIHVSLDLESGNVYYCGSAESFSSHREICMYKETCSGSRENFSSKSDIRC